MGLDARVYCDCVEKGKLLVTPDFFNRIFIEGDGFPTIKKEKTTDFDLFWEWIDSGPCMHKDFILLHHRLGNIAVIGFIRTVLSDLSKDPLQDYPIIWSKVIYSGTHAGDYLTLSEVNQLHKELIN